MSEDIDNPEPVAEARGYRWRPAVPPYRVPGICKIRARKSLPGQKRLPGMESDGPSVGPLESIDSDQPTEPEIRHGRPYKPALPQPELACPNCGSTEFDDDGDCIQCWEPGVVGVDTQPKAQQG
jgi:hypothetical protein